MQTQIDLRLPASIRFAQLLNRALSWGMPPEQRHVFLTETLGDWEEMEQDQGSFRVIVRALRGIPTAMWARLDERDITALPAAIAIAIVGAAGIAAGLLDGTYPSDIRRFVLLSALGTLVLGATLIADPRRVVLRRYRLPAVLLTAGFWGMAANMPTVEDWQYETPFVDTVLADVAMVVGFVLVGIGFAMVVIASFATRRRLVLTGAGLTIMTGTALFGCGQIAWGVVAVNTDPTITVVSIGIGLAALSFLHVVPRLRRLQIV